MQETWIWSLHQEDPLEKEMTNHSSILAWEGPRTVEPGGLQSMGSQKSWIRLTTTNKTHGVAKELDMTYNNKQNPNYPGFFYYWKEPWNWKRDCYKFKCCRHLQFSNLPFYVPSTSQWRGSKGPQRLFPTLPLDRLGEKLLQIGDESLPVLNNTKVTLSMFKHIPIKQLCFGILKSSTSRVEPQEAPDSESIAFV